MHFRKMHVYNEKVTAMSPRHIAALLVLFLSGMLPLECRSDRDVRYYCRDHGFSISFPEGWKIRENVMGTRILAEMPEDRDGSIIKQNVNVVVETVRSPLSIARYIGLQMNGLKKLKGMKIFETGDASVSGMTAKWFTCSYTINDFGYRAVVYALNRETTFYVVTGISQSNNFGRYERVFHKTARSFRFE